MKTPFVIFLFIIMFIGVACAEGGGVALIIMIVGVTAGILQHLGFGRRKFDPETEEAIKSGIISVEDAYRAYYTKEGTAAYRTSAQWEEKRKREEEEQKEISKRILEYNRKHFGI